MAIRLSLKRAAVVSSLMRSKQLDTIRSASITPRPFSRSFSTGDDNGSDDDGFPDGSSFRHRRGPLPVFIVENSEILKSLLSGLQKGLKLKNTQGRQPFEMKEDEDAMSFRMDLPGLGKEDIKVLVENQTLSVVKLKRDSEDVDDESQKLVILDVPRSRFKVLSLKADIKNGVLNLVVPKVKKEG